MILPLATSSHCSIYSFIALASLYSNKNDMIMVCEMVDVALLIATLVEVYFVIKIYLVLKAACERRNFPLQGPEMEEDQRVFPVQAAQMEEEQNARHGAADQRCAVQRHSRQIINLRAAGNRARPQEHDERPF